MSLSPGRRYTVEEYFELERTSEFRHEYDNGEVWRCGDPRPIWITEGEAQARHERLVAAVVATLKARVTDAALSVVRDASIAGTMADVAVLAEAGGHTEKRSPVPIVVVEVLSPYTEGTDRGDKAVRIRAVAPVSHLLLVAQDRPSIELYARRGIDKWLYLPAEGWEAEVALDLVGCRLPLREVYGQVPVFAPE